MLQTLPLGFRPFLSCLITIEEVVAWPQEKKNLYTASVKYDGVRILITQDEVYSRNMEPIANRELANLILTHRRKLKILSRVTLDCEVVSINGFASANKAIQTIGGLPKEKINVIVFDSFIPEHLLGIGETCRGHHIAQVDSLFDGDPTANLLIRPSTFKVDNDINATYNTILKYKGEGIILRKTASEYKFGRATPTEATYFKVKPSYDSEAIIIGIHEGETNINPAKASKIGLTKRSTHAAGKRGNGTLGTIKVIDINPESPFYHRQFSIGTFEGLTKEDLQKIYGTANEYAERKINYKYAGVASLGLPRHPVFTRFI